MSNSTESAFEAAAAAPQISLTTPILYFSILVALLFSFSLIHRRAKISSMEQLTATPLFFPSHNREWEQEAILSPTPDSTPAVIFQDVVQLTDDVAVRKAALLMRASESLRRLFKLKECEQGITNLYTRGLIGDESYQHFKLQLKLQDAEMKEIVMAAEQLAPKWGSSQLVIANAQETVMNLALRRRLDAFKTREGIFQDLHIKGVEAVLEPLQKRMETLKNESLKST